jgi:Flavin containing amine oxidoreductase
MNRFLALTSLPEWYPLSTKGIGKQSKSKALGMLNLRQNKGLLKTIEPSPETKSRRLAPISAPALQSMDDRRRFRVCVVGGGIAGLSTCLELFRVCDREGIEVEVVLLEGRDRLGGRIHTDSRSLSTSSDEEPVLIEMGASWIHGVEKNPIMSLACETGVTFVNVVEEVQMLHSGAVKVDPGVDEKTGELFDELLDSAVRCAFRQ